MRAQDISKTVPAETGDSSLVADVSLKWKEYGEGRVSRRSADVDQNQLSVLASATVSRMSEMEHQGLGYGQLPWTVDGQDRGSDRDAISHQHNCSFINDSNENQQLWFRAEWKNGVGQGRPVLAKACVFLQLYGKNLKYLNFLED